MSVPGIDPARSRVGTLTPGAAGSLLIRAFLFLSAMLLAAMVQLGHAHAQEATHAMPAMQTAQANSGASA